MRTTMLISLAFCSAVMLGCEADNDRAANFVGEWALRAEVRCVDLGGYSAFLGDLKSGPHVTFTRIDPSHIKLAMTPECEVGFLVAPDYTATSPAGQTCQIDVPTLGTRAVSIGDWQLGVTDPATVVANSYTTGYIVVDAPQIWTNLKGAVDGCSMMTLQGGMARPN